MILGRQVVTRLALIEGESECDGGGAPRRARLRPRDTNGGRDVHGRLRRPAPSPSSSPRPARGRSRRHNLGRLEVRRHPSRRNPRTISRRRDRDRLPARARPDRSQAQASAPDLKLAAEIRKSMVARAQHASGGRVFSRLKLIAAFMSSGREIKEPRRLAVVKAGRGIGGRRIALVAAPLASRHLGLVLGVKPLIRVRVPQH